jgi:AbrB family looped-hinge helix DNA binding protein
MTTTIDQNGTVALPKDVLREVAVRPGDELEVSTEDGNIILRKTSEPGAEGLLEILQSLKGLPIPERHRSSVRDVQL